MEQAFGADIPPSTYFGMAVLIGLPILGFIAFEMWKTLGDNRRVRKERRKLEAIEAVGYFAVSFKQQLCGVHNSSRFVNRPMCSGCTCFHPDMCMEKGSIPGPVSLGHTYGFL